VGKGKAKNESKNDITFEQLYYRYKEHPTEWTLSMVIRELCKMEKLWFSAKVKMPKEFEELAGSSGAIPILHDDAEVRGNVLLSEDGAKLYLVFTDVDKFLTYRDCFKRDSEMLAIGKTRMRDILNIVQEHEITHILINYTHGAQIVLDERSIEIIRQTIVDIEKEYDEESDKNYNQGWEYKEEAHQIYFGIGVKKDREAALQLYSKAAQLLLTSAEKGNIRAQYDLGLLIRNGKGVEQDFKKAAYWLRRSVENSDNCEKRRIEEIILEFKFYDKSVKNGEKQLKTHQT
jgi:hypothetical protein